MLQPGYSFVSFLTAPWLQPLVRSSETDSEGDPQCAVCGLHESHCWQFHHQPTPPAALHRLCHQLSRHGGTQVNAVIKIFLLSGMLGWDTVSVFSPALLTGAVLYSLITLAHPCIIVVILCVCLLSPYHPCHLAYGCSYGTNMK